MTSRRETHVTNKPRFFYGWYMVAVSWIMLFMMNSVAVAIFFKPILEEFGFDRAALSLVHTIAMIVIAIAAPFMGRLVDRYGPRAILFVVLGAQSLSSVINGLATSIWHLYIGRLLYEMKPLHSAQVMINRWFVKKRGKALGIFSTGQTFGMLVLAPISQYLILFWGWRETMLFWAGVTFIILLPSTLSVRNNPEDKGYGPDGEPPRRDIPILPNQEPETTAQEAKTITATGSNLAGAIKTSSFWLLAATHIICGIGCGFMTTHIVIFATDVGYSEMIGASFLSIQGGANLVGLLVTGYMSDRIARSKVLALTHFIRSLSFIFIVIFLLSGNGPLWLLYIAMMLFGFGSFTTAPLASGLVADLFGYLRMGTIIGVILSFHYIGAALGAYAGGITFELTGSYYLCFLVQGVLEFIAVLFALAIKRQSAR